MTRYPVWMDCDTGTDDAIAILLAHVLDEIDLLALSAVCGNTSQANAYANTLRLLRLAGADTPVYRGAEKPLIRAPLTASAFHGSNGLGDVELPLPEPLVERPEIAWDALYACAAARPGELRLIATGPLTNVATAFIKYPDLPGLLHSLSLMGGSATAGNVTPAAEFNIYADPDAADIVFRSGANIIMFGLDVTMQTYMTAPMLEEYAAAGTAAGRFMRDVLQCALRGCEKYNYPGPSMHDSCPVMALAHPELFSGQDAGVAVETRGTISVGKTVTDLFSDKKFPFKNAKVMLDVDRERFLAILKERILSL